MRLPRAQRLMLRLQRASLILSLRLAPASPALEGGKPPLTPPLRTQYLPKAKRYNWIFVIFSGQTGSKMDSKSLISHYKGHKYPVPSSILQCASFWSVSNLVDVDLFRDIVGLSDFRTFGLSDFRTFGLSDFRTFGLSDMPSKVA